MFEYLSTAIVIVTTIFVIVYLYFKYISFNYWKKLNVPYESPSFPFGNVPISYFLGYLPIGDLVKATYDRFKKHPFHGIYIFHKPILVVNDPELVKIVLIRDFSKFIDRGWYHDEKTDPLSNNLFFQPGEKWRRLRGKFTPIFTPQKLKNIHGLMVTMANEMIKVMDEELEKSDTLEMMNIVRRFTTDIICTVVYGLETGTLNNAQSEFRKYGMKIADFGRITQLFAMFLPEVLENITIPFFNAETKNFFRDIFNQVVEYRREKNIVRKDMLNLLIQLVDKGSVEDEESTLGANDKDRNPDKVSMLEAAAQAFIFFLGGIETTSSTVSYCLLEMGLNPDIQNKLQEEIDRVVESTEGVTYDALMEMEYLEMVITETMRKYPPVALLNRMALEDFPVPHSDFVIPKGMRIIIPVTGLHNDPAHYPNPDKFNPSRQSKEQIACRNPCLELAFGKGPRDCIGRRYGGVQSKQAVVSVLYRYNVRVSDKTKFPITFNTENIIQQPGSGIYLHFEKRRK
ncbi:cytochrome P450 6A1-like [Phymastichus coffea]|uniref:cytochrome P450 6A1-like n=1 Tax=Phymastichus coffea TaxID=108790 RepID=UPI00273B3286|nr:cytochrome P450 6A1-like [Phymastichus coffea]